ncbi:MAG TPA: ABC transporter permease, partial [Thermoleophilaceae bacterium]|nr:ABC transporter permease [Thermoleophilaceae bacterium]
YRPEAGPGAVVAALALVVVFAFGLSWAFTTLGLVMRAPNAVMNTGFMVLFPITFISNAFVEEETLPSALQTVVDVNPISHLITAARGLMDGNPDGGEILLVLAVAAALTLLFAPITSRLYRRAA